MSDTRQHAHELIDRLPETQISAAVGFLQGIVDPAFEDEKISEKEEATVVRCKDLFKDNERVPVVADLGFTMEPAR